MSIKLSSYVTWSKSTSGMGNFHLAAIELRVLFALRKYIITCFCMCSPSIVICSLCQLLSVNYKLLELLGILWLLSVVLWFWMHWPWWLVTVLPGTQLPVEMPVSWARCFQGERNSWISTECWQIGERSYWNEKNRFASKSSFAVASERHKQHTTISCWSQTL